ncbi:hypothetical protein ColKHC_06159 [Colletotrichum higginsianum]|nr:hypothetical protein ColKHC_06159 [Colletotrichum higginsianum]
MSMNQYAWASQAQAQPEVVNGTQMSLRQRAMSRQQSGVIAPLDLATRDNRINGHQLSIDAQHLSPINETRSPSPTVGSTASHSKQAQSSAQSPKRLSTSTQRSVQVATQSQAQTSSQAPTQSPKVNGIRENGHTRGVKSESHGPEGTWQKATKGRRKGADAKNQQGGGFVPSEQPPKHEADRKGG